MNNVASRFLSLVKNRRRPLVTDDFYQAVYEAHAQEVKDETVIGGGGFDLVGALELSALILAGLKPDHALLDFGCGIGRLAVQAIPYLSAGKYCGVDISPTLLSQAKQRCAALGPSSCRIDWLLERHPSLSQLLDASFDYAAAFSVFTHIEHEDTLHYLQSLRRIIRPGGKLLFSHLLIEENGAAKQIFTQSSNCSIRARYSKVRNIVSSKSMMDTLAQMSGWSVDRWIRHDEEVFLDSASGNLSGLGQAVCILSSETA
jgi:ubiquinone/menaquinone biosynthesis C-methylase UbiE